jgi:hypothetical protein
MTEEQRTATPVEPRDTPWPILEAWDVEYDARTGKVTPLPEGRWSADRCAATRYIPWRRVRSSANTVFGEPWQQHVSILITYQDRGIRRHAIAKVNRSPER